MDLAKLTTEAGNPASEQIDRLSAQEIVELMNAEDATVPVAVSRVLQPIAAAAATIADRLRAGGRLIYMGAGTSGRLGVLDASECPPTFNSRPWQVVGLIAGGPTALTRAVEGAEDSPQRGEDDLRRIGLTAADVVVGIATSGRTPYVVGGLRYARANGATTIGLACNDDSALTAVAELMIEPIVGPEIISGSTRMKAGTATKLVLNMLSTTAMVLLGKTYGNLMVDLQTTNEKLMIRSRRIVSALAGVDLDEAESLLQQCGGDTKTAIVTKRRNLTPEDSRRLLVSADGQLRSALQSDLPDDVDVARQDSADIPRDLILGLDGGGSKTVAWLCRADGASEVAWAVGQAGPSNPQTVGWSRALDNVDLALERAFRSVGRNRRPVRAACLSLAGAGRGDDRQRIDAWARQRQIAKQILVTHDAMPVLAAGTPEGVGIALIAGTGSLAFGRNASGQSARAGGWGHLMGDEGSGYAIALEGLQAVARAWDGRGPETILGQLLSEALRMSDRADVLRALYERQADRDWLASLSRHVLAAADQGDSVSQQIVNRAADELVDLLQFVIRRLGMGLSDQPIPVALAGGVLVNSALLRCRLAEMVVNRDLPAVQWQVVLEPVMGAIRLAARRGYVSR